jgi:hypothetical protein
MSISKLHFYRQQFGVTICLYRNEPFPRFGIYLYNIINCNPSGERRITLLHYGKVTVKLNPAMLFSIWIGFFITGGLTGIILETA